MFRTTSITEIPTNRTDVHAFRFNGHVSADASEDLAEHMNAVFDAADGKVSMLMDLTNFEGSDWTAIFDDDVAVSRVRSISSVEKYAVIGAPEKASRMIEFMDKLIPVDARAFEAHEVDAAWSFVGAQETSAAA